MWRKGACNEKDENGRIGDEATPFPLDDLMGEMTLALSLSKVVYPMAEAIMRHFVERSKMHICPLLPIGGGERLAHVSVSIK
jgi:hypothetical protein